MKYLLIGCGLLILCVVGLLVLWHKMTPESVYYSQQATEIQAKTSVEKAETQKEVTTVTAPHQIRTAQLQAQKAEEAAIFAVEKQRQIHEVQVLELQRATTLLTDVWVLRAALARTILWLLLPFLGCCGLVILAYTRREWFVKWVDFADGETQTKVPAPLVPTLLQQSLAIKQSQSFQQAMSFQEDLTHQRLGETVGMVRALKSLVPKDHPSLLALLDHSEGQNGKIPTLQELLTREEIAPGKPMILGYEQGVPRRGSFLDIYSSAVAGESGSGKTATLLFLIGSGLITENVRYFAIDPHYPHPKSLGFKTRPLWEAGLITMATYKDDMLDVLNEVEHIIDNRLKQIDTDTTPVVLVIDELAFLSKTSVGKQIMATMERISTEGRKCSVYLLASSQTWIASRLGKDSTFRDTLTSAFVHRLKPKQANLLLQDKDETEKVKKYVKQAGDVLLCPVGDESVVCQIPYTTETDIQQVANMMTKTLVPYSTIPLLQKTPQKRNTEAREVKLTGGEIKFKREQKNLTQGQLSALLKNCGCEIPQAKISRAENGKNVQWTEDEMSALESVLLTNLVPLNTHRNPPDTQDIQ
jgi:hypothetical protein